MQGHQSLWLPENKNVFKDFSQMMFKATTEAKAQGQLFKDWQKTGSVLQVRENVQWVFSKYCDIFFVWHSFYIMDRN